MPSTALSRRQLLGTSGRYLLLGAMLPLTGAVPAQAALNKNSTVAATGSHTTENRDACHAISDSGLYQLLSEQHHTA